MFSFLADNVFFKLLSHADWLSKLIFFALMCMSVACWWIFIFKLMSLKRKVEEARYARARLQTVVTLEELAHLGAVLQKTDAGVLIANTLSAVRKLIKSGGQQPVMKKSDQDQVTLVLNQTLSELVKQEEAYIPVVRLSAESGPLIGLFGTVWGLIHAFNRISERQTADIPTVAPGIAEALVVTLTGLFVAIPALIQYVAITRKLAALEHELSVVADRIEWIIMTAVPNANKEWGTFHETTWTHQVKQ